MTMKQQLLKTLALGLLLVGGVTSAWGDNTVTVTTGGSSTDYATLKAAIEANVLTNATADMTITISADQSLGDKVISWEKAYTLTIKSTKAITIKGPNGSRWFTVKNASANLVVGDGNYEITLDGEYDGTSSKPRTQAVALRNNTTASITFNKVTFKDFNLNNAVNMIVAENGGGSLTLQNVTISNCVNPKNGYIDNQRVENDKVLLKGYLNIDEASTGTAFYLALETKSGGTAGRIKIMDDGFTASKPLSIEYHETSTSYTPAIGASFVVKDGSLNNFTDAQVKMFTLTDIDKGLVKNNKDLKLTQAYTLTVSDAGAATLVLPFASTIPTGAACYKLDYTSGDNITATAESTTLAKDNAVLVIAEAGKYKFVSTATSGSAATGSGQTSAYGVLVGNYTADYVVPASSYILTKHDDAVGFRKANGTSNKVAAYRAYMTATHSGSAPSFLGIDFTNGSATAINAVEKKSAMEDGKVYNLQGVRMNAGNLPKGIYVKNGKKFIVK